MKRSRRGSRRGAALITVMVLMAVLLSLVGALLVYSNAQRTKSIIVSRSQTRATCAQSGLQFARAFFGRNAANWNTYLQTPAVYNPVGSTWNTGAAGLLANVTARPFPNAFQTANPQLFTDLDGDGRADVYIYVRDNDDEPLPAAPNPQRDNDQNIIIGAMCISDTLNPRLQDGSANNDLMLVESLLSLNAPGTFYYAQAANGAAGDGNANR